MFSYIVALLLFIVRKVVSLCLYIETFSFDCGIFYIGIICERNFYGDYNLYINE